MDLIQALTNIKNVTDVLPEKEFACIRANKGEAIPTLLEYVKAVVEMGKDLPKDYNAHTYAMFLLAEFRVHEAFPYFIEYLKFDLDTTEYLLGDTLTEDFGSILASVATTGDIPRIMDIVEDSELYIIQRSTALNALQVLYAEDVFDREEYFAYLRRLLETCWDDPELLAFVIIDCRLAGDKEFLPVIEPLYKKNLVAEDIASLSFTQESLSVSDIETSKQLLRQRKYSSFVHDALMPISSWYCFMKKSDNRSILGID